MVGWGLKRSLVSGLIRTGVVQAGRDVVATAGETSASTEATSVSMPRKRIGDREGRADVAVG